MKKAMLKASEVAELLGYATTTFYQKRKQLEALGFPKRHNGTQRYSRRLVEEWIRDGAPRQSGAEPLGSTTGSPAANANEFKAWQKIAMIRTRRRFTTNA